MDNTTKQIANLYEIHIRNWVLENFGESEAEDPSWNVEALAKDLAKYAYEVYSTIERNYVKEDMKYVSQDWEKKPTEKQLEYAADRYINSDAYASIDREGMEWFIHEEIKKGE
jgi:hypothetical protein